jgi:DNA-binding phage protein
MVNKDSLVKLAQELIQANTSNPPGNERAVADILIKRQELTETRLCDIKNHMDIGTVLRDVIAREGRSIRRMSMDLHIDRASLHRSLRPGANPEWKTIERVLGYLGYKIELVKAQSETK